MGALWFCGVIPSFLGVIVGFGILVVLILLVVGYWCWVCFGVLPFRVFGCLGVCSLAFCALCFGCLCGFVALVDSFV